MQNSNSKAGNTHSSAPASANKKNAVRNHKKYKSNATKDTVKDTHKKQSKKSYSKRPKNYGKNASGLNLYDSISPRELKEKPSSVKIKFLGGINEIGKNLTLFEYNDEMIIVDCGMSFPDADMPGIDYVLPDITYVERNKDRIKSVFITHAHEDHIGGLPYLLKAVNVPVYCTCLTAGLISAKLKEHRILNKCKIEVIEPGKSVDVGEFTVEAIHVNHSIPDALAFAIKCGAGTIVHTGDFKIDNTPIDGGVIDLSKFAELGNEGVLCLLSDSTNSERPGYTPSEKNVGETLEMLFRRAQGKRIIVASFASNIHRIQQIIDASEKIGRKIFLSGRSLENATAISVDLGYMHASDGVILPIDKLRNYRDEDVVIITTGSQGEPMSALSRMALGDHKKVTIDSNDFVIISATPIPGNEKTVANTINELMKLGAEVIYEKNLGIHVSGHAAQEEQKLILNLVKPKFFIPVHGEQKHLRRHAATASSVGIPKENIVVPDLGAVIEVSELFIDSNSSVPVGRVFVDGTGVCDVGKSILRDRKNLSTDGVVVVTAVTDAYSGELVTEIDVQTKGFVFENNSNELVSFVNRACEKVFYDYVRSVNMDIYTLKTKLKESITKAIFDKTRRSPIVIVTVLAV
ncbi:MAG: ribonuclease J [Clostridia bacterium]|nr:ribonuclease J [Clostridia bacterium]